MSDTKDPNIDALLEELRGYIQYGKPDRAEQVRADLKRRGYSFPEGRSTKASKQATAAPKSEG